MSSKKDKNYLIELAEFRRRNFERDPDPAVARLLAEDYAAISPLAYMELKGTEGLKAAADWLLKAAKYRLDAYRMSGNAELLREYVQDMENAADMLEGTASDRSRAGDVYKELCDEVMPLGESSEYEDISVCAKCFNDLGTFAYESYVKNRAADDIVLAANSFLTAADIIMKLNCGTTAVSANGMIRSILDNNLLPPGMLSSQDPSLLHEVYTPEKQRRLRQHLISAFDELKAQVREDSAPPRMLMLTEAARGLMSFASSFKLSGMLSEYTVEAERWSYKLASESGRLSDEAMYINDASRCFRYSALIYEGNKKEFFSMIERAGEMLKKLYLRAPDPDLNGFAESWLGTVLGSVWFTGRTRPIEVFSFLGDIVRVYDAAIEKELIGAETVFEKHLGRIAEFFTSGFDHARKYRAGAARRFLIECSAVIAMKKYGVVSPDLEAPAEGFAAYLAEKHPGKATDEAVKALENARKARLNS
ncbi:MAG: hypothetical protein II191_04375 [Clostridia bacterium]|nr:hypothetical protein [Clostridia bacterium]